MARNIHQNSKVRAVELRYNCNKKMFWVKVFSQEGKEIRCMKTKDGKKAQRLFDTYK